MISEIKLSWTPCSFCNSLKSESLASKDITLLFIKKLLYKRSINTAKSLLKKKYTFEAGVQELNRVLAGWGQFHLYLNFQPSSQGLATLLPFQLITAVSIIVIASLLSKYNSHSTEF